MNHDHGQTMPIEKGEIIYVGIEDIEGPQTIRCPGCERRFDQVNWTDVSAGERGRSTYECPDPACDGRAVVLI